MSLINFIEKIQKKPRYVRIQILWLSVFVSMFIIVSFWVVSLKDSSPQIVEDKTPQKLKDSMPSLKETLKASISGFFKKDDLEDKENEFNSKKRREEVKPSKLPSSF